MFRRSIHEFNSKLMQPLWSQLQITGGFEFERGCGYLLRGNGGLASNLNNDPNRVERGPNKSQVDQSDSLR